MNIIEFIRAEANSDDENTEKQSDILNRNYDEGTDEQKEAIDEALMCICGWTMKTIREKAPHKNMEDYL